MRLPLLALFPTLLLAGFAPNVMACQFDTDCGVGSQCLKGGGSIYGVCAGGMNPGNHSDRSPVYSPTDPNHSVGNTCNWDTDCGPGSSCVKGTGQIHGVCMR